jgi:DNA-binding MarR family transcriptional regulator
MSAEHSHSTDSHLTRQAALLLDGLRALIRTQQLSERANVSCCGMSVAQAATLQVLHLEGPMRLGALSRRLGIAPSTLTRNVERIEARGWVERVPDPVDGRALEMHLTTDGRTRARALEDQNQQFARYLLAELPPERRERVLAGLLDLLEAIDRLAGDVSAGQFMPIRAFLQARRAMDTREDP